VAVLDRTLGFRTLARRLTTGVLTFGCGCFPAITHGARVEDGVIVGVTGGLGSGDTHVEGDEGGIRLRQPIIGPFVGYGSAPARRDLPRFYVGAAVPVFFPLAQVDAYMQLPPAWTGPVAMGVGAVASSEGVTGYALLGGDLNQTSSWHIGAGYGRRQSSSRFQSSSGAWVGSAAIESAHGYLRTQVFLQGAVGNLPGSCFDDPAAHRSTCTRGEHTSAVALGVTLGRHQKKRQ